MRNAIACGKTNQLELNSTGSGNWLEQTQLNQVQLTNDSHTPYMRSTQKTSPKRIRFRKKVTQTKKGRFNHNHQLSWYPLNSMWSVVLKIGELVRICHRIEANLMP